MQDNVTQAEKAWHRHERSPYAKSAAEDEKHAFMCGFQAAHRLASTTAQSEAVRKLVEALEAISQHAGHTEECSFYWDGGQSCDCGYLAAHAKKAQALAAHRESQP